MYKEFVLVALVKRINIDHHHHYQTLKELGHSLTRSGLDPRVSSLVVACLEAQS
jgi:hypothetical protein